MRRAGFSLVELVIVVVILGIVAGIGIARTSCGAAGAAESAAVKSVSVLNKATELYAAEHGGAYPSAAQVVLQLVHYTDEAGNVSLSPTPVYVYGPYLRQWPVAPLGPHKGESGVAQVGGAGIAWLYDPAVGRFELNMAP